MSQLLARKWCNNANQESFFDRGRGRSFMAELHQFIDKKMDAALLTVTIRRGGHRLATIWQESGIQKESMKHV
jgi:hypothetical protein